MEISDPQAKTLAQQLISRISTGQLQEDPEQLIIANRMDALIETLVREKSGWFPGRKWLSGILAWLKHNQGLKHNQAKDHHDGKPRRHSTGQPKGIYLWGGVGRGKSMLMDSFVQLARQVHGLKVSRFHFHDFMTAAHAQVHEERQQGKTDPTAGVMTRLTHGADVICFDEMEVRDIADAMIIARVMDGYMKSGGVLIATSNRHPDDLYQDGLQRERFLPFIEALKTYNDVIEMQGETDWRRRVLAGIPGWYHPLNTAADMAMQTAMEQLSGGIPLHPVVVPMAGRELTVDKAAGGAAWMSFDALCAVPLAAADYLLLAERFAGMLISHIPKLNDANQNEARRFMWLVDAFYDRKRFLICSAETPIHDLYQGHQWKAEFPRTMSRLQEMSRLPEAPTSISTPDRTGWHHTK
jgi:cell division protein ZapE